MNISKGNLIISQIVYNMFSKKDLVNLIRKTPYENSQKLSFDYFLPIPDRDFGEERGGKPKWRYELDKVGGVTGWIKSNDNYDTMKKGEEGIVSFGIGGQSGAQGDLPVGEEKLSKKDKEKRKEQLKQTKLDLLQQLVYNSNNNGMNSPASPASLAPNVDVLNGNLSPFRTLQNMSRQRGRMSGDQEVQEPVASFEERTGAGPSRPPNRIISGLLPSDATIKNILREYSITGPGEDERVRDIKGEFYRLLDDPDQAEEMKKIKKKGDRVRYTLQKLTERENLADY